MMVSLSAGVVIERNGLGQGMDRREVLFVMRPDGNLQIPSGHVESGESIIECVVREFLEEIGYRVTIDGLVKIIYFKGDICYRLGFIFHGIMSSHMLKASEHPTCWLNATEFIKTVGKRKIFVPEFNIPAFWEGQERKMLRDFKTYFL